MSVNSNYGNTLRNDDSFSVIEASISYNVQSAFSDDEIWSKFSSNEAKINGQNVSVNVRIDKRINDLHLLWSMRLIKIFCSSV